MDVHCRSTVIFLRANIPNGIFHYELRLVQMGGWMGGIWFFITVKFHPHIRITVVKSHFTVKFDQNIYCIVYKQQFSQFMPSYYLCQVYFMGLTMTWIYIGLYVTVNQTLSCMLNCCVQCVDKHTKEYKVIWMKKISWRKLVWFWKFIGKHVLPPSPDGKKMEIRKRLDDFWRGVQSQILKKIWSKWFFLKKWCQIHNS